MKLFYKLIIGFLIVASMSWVTGYFAIENSRNALRKAFIENTESLAVDLLDGIEKGIDAKVEIFRLYTHDMILQETVEESNRDFNHIRDLRSFVTEKNKEWISAPKDEITPFMHGLLNNKLSKELREKIRFFEDHYGYKVFGEIFVTNKYGANMALSNKTTDYMQDDEEWWQIAKADGSFISDVVFDDSAGIYSIDLALRIEDEAGDFSGVLKVVLNIENILDAIADIQMAWVQKGHKSNEFKILDNIGRIIYSTKDYEFLGDGSYLIPADHLSTHANHEKIYSERIKRKNNEDTDLFVSHVHSSGKSGISWILVVEQEADELFAPVASLRNRIIAVSITGTLLGILIGFILSSSISRRVDKLKDAAGKVGKGDPGVRIDIEGNDEIGQLAESFKKMTENIKSTTVARDELIHEVEKREIIETELEISSNLLTTVLDGIEAVVYVADIKTYEVLYVNQYTKDMFGDIEGKTCWKVLQSDKKAPCDFCTNDKLLTPDGKPGNVYNWEFQNTSNGRWYDIRDRAIYWIDGRIARLEIATDITDRKNAEEKIESPAKFPAENPNPVLRIDSNMNILYKNEAVNDLLKKAGLSDENLYEILPKGIENLVKRSLNSKQLFYSLEVKVDDSIYSYNLISFPEHNYVNLYGRNITERVEAENQLLRANKEIEKWNVGLEKRVQEKTEELEKSQMQLVQSEKLASMGQLSAGLAHELNSPLAGLLPLLQKYKKTAETGSEAYGDVTLMLRASEHMAKIVRDFSSFAGKPVKELFKFRIEDIIESTLSFSSGELDKQGVEIIEKYQDSLPKVLGNKTELQQVVLNIITNARDAMPDGGTFIIKTGIDGGKVKAEFTDNGVGIAKEDVSRVFDPFFTTKPQGKGVGLGWVFRSLMVLLKTMEAIFWSKANLKRELHLQC